MGRDVSSSPPPAVVFDFDGTLVSRDSVIDFSWRYCAKRPWRLLMLALLLPLAAIMTRATKKTSAPSVLLWAMTVGASKRRFVRELQRYAAHILPGYVNEGIFNELARHLQSGERVVIATGSLPILVRGLLQARGDRLLPVAGSRFRGKWGGLVVETHCTGRTKVSELKRKFGILTWSTVYTDSLADRPLMRGARDVVLIGPSSRTLSGTQQLLGTRIPLRVLPPR